MAGHKQHTVQMSLGYVQLKEIWRMLFIYAPSHYL